MWVFDVLTASPGNSGQKLIIGFQVVYHSGLSLKEVHLSEVNGLPTLCSLGELILSQKAFLGKKGQRCFNGMSGCVL